MLVNQGCLEEVKYTLGCSSASLHNGIIMLSDLAYCPPRGRHLYLFICYTLPQVPQRGRYSSGACTRSVFTAAQFLLASQLSLLAFLSHETQ